METMGQPKNRRKKAMRAKKSRTKTKRDSPEPTAAVETEEVLASSDELEQVELHPEGEGGGMMIGMRSLISGAKPVKEGFFSRRRTLAEWLLWFAGLIGLYYLYQYVRPLLGD